MEKFTDSTSDDFWIGANRLQTPGIWGWIDGSAFTFTDWDKGQPQNVTGADCGAVKIQSGLWSAKDCFMQKPFVCAVAALNAESTTTIALTTTTTQVTSTTTTSTKATTTTIRPKPKNCPISWTYYNLTGFYLAYYTEADGSTYNNAAIGFYTEDDNAHWQWTDGTPFDFPNWSPPEPNNPGVENCGEMYLRSMDVWKAGQFNNIPCDRTIARYICKKPPS
uniref:C-type lectin domain-containing protein n=1 Tax=Panagrolaimus davidi TaxID=227884 RepID=A0A914Q2B9_9BILA